MIGIVLLYVLKDMRILALFPNFFIGAYLAISGCSLYKITNKKTVTRVIVVSMLLAYIRELCLINVNLRLKTLF